ncbi:MAG: hypothetical protein QM627_06650 [Luteolibacter sp.]
MSQLSHHFRKDLRFARYWIAFTWLVSAAIFRLAWISPEKSFDSSLLLDLPRYAGWFALALTVFRLIHLDAPRFESAFLKTKSAAPGTILRSKALVILCTIVPMAAMQVLLFPAMGMKIGLTEALFIFVEELIILAAIAAFCIVIAAQKRSPGGYPTSLPVMIVCLGLLWFGYVNCRDLIRHHEKIEWSYPLGYLEISRLLAAQCAALLGAVATLIVYVRSSRPEIFSWAMPGICLTFFAAYFFWPVNFIEPLVPKRVAAREEWPNPAKLRFSYQKSHYYRAQQSTLSFGDGGYNDGTYRTIYAAGLLEGLTNGWTVASENGYESRLILPDLPAIERHREGFGNPSPLRILSDFGILQPLPAGTSRIKLTEFKRTEAMNAQRSAQVKGTFTLPFRRPVLLKRLPFKNGMQADLDDRFIRLHDIEQVRDEIQFRITERMPVVRLLGGDLSKGENKPDYLVINARKKEYLKQRSGGGSGEFYGRLLIQHHHITAHPSITPDENPIAADWLDDAELLVIGYESGGSYSQAFDFRNLSLGDIP